jgi:hypothetical protein
MSTGMAQAAVGGTWQRTSNEVEVFPELATINDVT